MEPLAETGDDGEAAAASPVRAGSTRSPLSPSASFRERDETAKAAAAAAVAEHRQLEVVIYEWNGRSGAGKRAQAPDAFCLARINTTEVARTKVVRREERPYWGEDYAFEIPEDEFKVVSFYVYESFGTLGKVKDYLVGKVAFKRSQLPADGPDQWWPLQPVDDDLEILGQIHLHTSVSETEPGVFSAAVRLLEGWAFPVADLYAELAIVSGDSPSSSSEVRKSSISKHSAEPKWCEPFYFPLPQLVRGSEEKMIWSNQTPSVLVVTIWRADTGGKPAFMGETHVPILSRHLANTHPPSEWYALAPRREAEEVDSSSSQLGSIRLKVNYRRETVLELKYYEILADLLTSVMSAKRITASPLWQLVPLVKNKEDLANVLVRFFSTQDKGVEFVNLLIGHEIRSSADKATLFRGNTLATKAVDQYMKLVGKEYLIDTLLPVIDEIFSSAPACEVDPLRLSSEESLQSNLANLQYHVNRALIVIVSTAQLCPPQLRRVFNHIQRTAELQFPGDETVRYTSVSGFIFLRFFAPAIMSPKLFGLTHKHPPPDVHRTLVLISKTLQNLGNIGREKAAKEAYMAPVNDKIVMKNKTMVMQFLDAISKPQDESAEAVQHLPAMDRGFRVSIIKEGYLSKRGQGRKKTLMGVSVPGLKNIKRRYFVLSTNGLAYHKEKGTDPIFRIRKECMLAVEKVDDAALGIPFTMQIVHSEGILYMCASNEPEQLEWLTELKRFCSSNPHPKRYYHPGIFGNAWTCCSNKSETHGGCTACTRDATDLFPRVSPLTQQSEAQLLERIHRFYLAGLPQLQSDAYVIETAAGEDEDFRKELHAGIERIAESCHSIEESHFLFRKPLEREGSKLRPHLSVSSLEKLRKRRGSKGPAPSSAAGPASSD